ncbi:MAG: hypothetical protein M9916_02305 [Crocinitomicaceae bacterium]|nr:hypothetical protein [Crocinitomicaceae bacterium]
MKKLIILIVSALSVGLLIYFGIRVINNSGSSVESELIEFAINDVEKIDRIVITDNFGRTMDLRLPKGAKEWTDKDGNCVQQEGVFYILDACKKIEFKGYLTDGGVETTKKMMLTQHTKVEYYINGSWSKTWYLGPASKDHLGQIMLLDSKELGMSDKPVIMSIKGMYGIIDPRFYADPLKWRCSQIFSIQPDEIKKVEVTYPLEPARSFSVENFGNKRFTVKQQNIPLAAVDTQYVMLYLNKFKKVHFEMPNYILNDKQVDSVKKSSPFCILKIDQTNGKSSTMRMFRIQAEEPKINEFGLPVSYEIDRFWGELPTGELVKCQYFVFDPLTMGHLYFPLDLKSLNLNNYEVKSPDQYKKD